MNKLFVVAIGAAGVAAVSLVSSVCTFVENRKMINKVKKSLGVVEERSEDKIAENMIEKAVEKAASNKVTKYMDEEEERILKASKEALRQCAQYAVSEHSNDIRNKAAEEVSKQVENLDIEELKRRVCDRAEQSVVKKFDGALDGEVKKFREQLDSTRKLYNRMVKTAIDEDDFDRRVRLVMI